MPVRLGKVRGKNSFNLPARIISSPPLTLAPCTRTSTSPGFTTGIGAFASYNTSGGPYRSYWATRISSTTLLLEQVEDLLHLFDASTTTGRPPPLELK
jgi:hypothetical protein